MAGKPTVAISVVADAAKARRELDSTGDSAKNLGSRFKSVGSSLAKVGFGVVAGGAVAAGAAFIGAAKMGVEGAMGYEKAINQANAALKANAHASNLTIDSMKERAATIETLSGAQFDENDSLAAQSALLRAGVKDSKLMDKALLTSANLASARGMEIGASSQLISKALQDPTKAAGKLAKVGVTLSDSQKKQIEAFTKAGQTAKAQGVIMDAIQGKYKGAAAAAGDTLAGRLGNLKDTFEDTARDIAMKVLPTLLDFADWIGKKLPPFMDKAGQAFGMLGGVFKKVQTFLAPVTSGIQKVISSFGGLRTSGGAVSSLKDTFTKFYNVVKPIFDQIVSTVLPLFQQYLGFLVAEGAKFVGWFQANLPTFTKAFSNIMTVVGAVVGYVWTLLGGTFLNVIKTVFKTVMVVIGGAMKVIKGVIQTVMAVLAGDWGKAWAGIKMAVSGVWQIIKGVISGAWSVIKTTIGGALGAVKTMISDGWGKVRDSISSALGRIKDSVVQKFNDVVSWIGGVPGLITSSLSGLGTLLWGAGEDIIRGLRDGLSAAFDKYVKPVLQWITDKIPDWKGPKKRDKVLLKPAGMDIMKSLVDGFKTATPQVYNFMKTLTNKLSKIKLNKKQRDALVADIAKATKALKPVAEKMAKVTAKLKASQSKLADLRKASVEYAKSVSQASYGGVFSVQREEGQSFVAALKAKLVAVKQFQANLKALKERGASKSLLSQIASAGVDQGGALAVELLGQGAGAIVQASQLDAQLQKAADSLGKTAADQQYKAAIAAQKGVVDGLIKQKSAIQAQFTSIAKRFARDIADELGLKATTGKNGVITIQGSKNASQDVKDMIKALQEYVRVNGPIRGLKFA